MKLNQQALKMLNRAHVRPHVRDIYYPEIPLTPIFDSLATVGVVVVQEDGTPWSGFLCGESGDANFDLTFNGQAVENARLNLQWYKMQRSGRYEITCYIG